MSTYSEKLKSHKWQKKRLEVFSRDNFKCYICGDDETELHVHHKSYEKTPEDSELSELITICKHCHDLTHFIIKENIGIKLNSNILKFKTDIGFVYYFIVEDNLYTILNMHNKFTFLQCGKNSFNKLKKYLK